MYELCLFFEGALDDYYSASSYLSMKSPLQILFIEIFPIFYQFPPPTVEDEGEEGARTKGRNQGTVLTTKIWQRHLHGSRRGLKKPTLVRK